MSLIKAWRNRIFFGAKNLELRPAPRMPGVGSIVFLLLAISALASPTLRHGVTSVVDVWRSSSGGYTANELRVLGERAERSRDAKMLAFVAMRLPIGADSVRWADQAVALDPNLTWVYFEMNGGSDPDYHMNDADFGPRAARLQQWDRDNAAPLLMQADRIFGNSDWSFDYQQRFSPLRGQDRTAEASMAFAKSHPDWAALMEKAFRSPRFDDYSQKRFELVLDVMRTHQLDQPLEIVHAVWGARLPDLLGIRVFSSSLERQGELRESAGDANAVQNYWEVVNFAQQMRIASNGVTIERLIALAIERSSFNQLQIALSKQGRADEAKYAAYEVQSVDAETKAMRYPNRESAWEEDATLWNGLVLHGTVVLMIGAGALSLVSLFWLGTTYHDESRSLGRKWLCGAARYSPVILVFSVVTFYLTYFPYVSTLRGATPENLHRLAAPLGAILDLSQLLSYGGRRYGVVYLWEGVTIAGVGIVMLMLARMILRANTNRHAAA
jgi:hypothetical protein